MIKSFECISLNYEKIVCNVKAIVECENNNCLVSVKLVHINVLALVYYWPSVYSSLFII